MKLGSRGFAGLCALFAAGVWSCGEVPTLQDNIAFISPVILPSLAVAAGDVLRDSLGNVATLSVQAYDRNSNPIAGQATTFVVASVPAGVSIDANGRVTAFDSLRTVQIVGQIGDRLQTAPISLEVVAQPDSIRGTAVSDSLVVFTASSPLSTTVTGNRRGVRVPVKSILVRYRISAIFPSRTFNGSLVFFSDGIRGDLTRAVDTTDAAGSAARSVTIASRTNLDSVRVEASATSLLGRPLTGSPVLFTLPVKKGT